MAEGQLSRESNSNDNCDVTRTSILGNDVSATKNNGKRHVYSVHSLARLLLLHSSALAHTRKVRLFSIKGG